MVSTRKRDYESDNSNSGSTVTRRQSTGNSRKRNDSGESKDSNAPEDTSAAAPKRGRRLSKQPTRSDVTSPDPSETSFDSLSQEVETLVPETPSNLRRSRRLSNSSDSGLPTPARSSRRARSSNSTSSSPSKEPTDAEPPTPKSIREIKKDAAAPLLSPIKESQNETVVPTDTDTNIPSPPQPSQVRVSDTKESSVETSAQVSIEKESEPPAAVTQLEPAEISSEASVNESNNSQSSKENDIVIESEQISTVADIKEEPADSDVQTINPPPPIVDLVEPKSETADIRRPQLASALPSGADVMRSIPRGKFKSGRPWKEPKTNPRNMYQDKGTKMGLEKAMQLKRELQRVKGLERKMKEERKQKIEDLKKRQELNKQRREENERRGEVVQAVSAAKLKRMKKKQLKLIQKRDTTNLV